jgi:hypothetical protein
MPTFEERLEAHDGVQSYVLTIFKRRGYPCARNGVESGEKLNIHQALMWCSNSNVTDQGDYTAAFIRNEPDLVVVIGGRAYYVEIKKSTSEDPDKFNINGIAMKTYFDRARLGNNIMFVLASILKGQYVLKACLLADMPQDGRVYELYDVKHEGIDNMFCTIMKSAPYLYDLDTLLNKLESEGKQQREEHPS